MKLILLFLVLFSGSVSAVDLIVGGWSKHIGQQKYPHGPIKVTYNANHAMIGLGVKVGGYYLSAFNYKNSFYTNSTAISAQYKIGSLHYGITIASGYDKWGLSNVGHLSVSPSVSYKFKYGAVAAMGAAIALIFSVPIGDL